VTLYRLLLFAYPRAFRERFGDDLRELFADLYRTRAAGMPLPRRALFWLHIIADTLRQGLQERLVPRRRLPFGVHRVRGASAMSLLLEDLRHAARGVRQQPGVSAVIMLTLALAIGANSAIFTVVNAVLLRPMPFTDPDRVVMLLTVDRNGRDSMVSVPDFNDWRVDLQSITGLTLMGAQSVNLTGVAEPDRLRGGFVSSNFFDMLGVQPIIGRAFAAQQDDRSAPKTAVLTYGTWQRRFGGDPSVVGRALMLNNEPHEVTGVLPPRFEFPIDAVEVWLPMNSSPIQDMQRNSRNTMVFGRVRADVSFEQAAAELQQVAARLAAAYPESNANWSARFQPFHEVTVRFVSQNLKLLSGAIAFVLLIACANIANLLLARASARQREMAVRAAIGASRGRMVRQLLTESLLLALAGGAVGLVLSTLLTDAMLALLPNLPRSEFVRPDIIVIAFTAALSIGTGLAFGVLPALRVSRPDLRTALGEGGRGGEGRATGRLRSVLVVAELALSLMLLAGAGLFIQSVSQLVNVDLGYVPDNVLTLEYRLPRNKYTTTEQQLAFHQRVVERLEAVPGIVAAAISSSVPQSGNGRYVGFWKSEDARPAPDAMSRAQMNAVTESYFAVMGIPVLEGRVCGGQDRPGGTLTLMVNRFMAERIWPGESALGKRLRAPDFPGEAVVVGVVGNTRPNLLADPVTSQVYPCISQAAGIFATVAVKTAGEPTTFARSVQQAIWSVDADQPMWKIRSSESLVLASVQRQRFVMLLMSFAAGLALLLAGLGTYSVLSYTVQRRAREVGLRMALGATRGSIVRLVLGQTARLTLLGVTLGLVGAGILSQVIAAELYNVSPRDPVTFATTALVLSSVALIAAWLPTRRATAVDPVVTLRTE
jgi:putative ABC transport system permease protein